MRWTEFLVNYSFSITHCKVVVEDCISRCPQACREPTEEEIDMEKDYEPDPIAGEVNLEELVKEIIRKDKGKDQPELICGLQARWEAITIPEHIRNTPELMELMPTEPPRCRHGLPI